MFTKKLVKILGHRRFWRDIQFDELSELYVSMLFRGIAMSLTGLFVPIFLIRLGYSVTEVLALLAIFFSARAAFLDMLSARTIARIGPKHTLLIGYVLLITSSLLFLSLPDYSWPLWFLGVVWGSSASFSFIPINVDFSKVKHSSTGGKEISFLNITERAGQVVGPILGGVIATLIGARYTFLISAILLLVGAIPLFRTAEPVRTRQKLKYRSFDWKPIKRDLVAYSALGVENTLSIVLWPFFLGALILLSTSVYAQIGGIASVSVILSLVAAYLFGKVIDRGNGRILMRISLIINAIIHLVRPFVGGFWGAFGTTVVNDVVTTGYRLPLYKAVYDAADDHPGYRIVYLSVLEMFSSLSKAFIWWVLVIISLVSTRGMFVAGFGLAAIMSCLILTERFAALRKGKNA